MVDQAELDRWNKRFSDPDYVFGTEPNAFLASQAARLKPGMKALTIADGEGRNGVWLARQGLEVTAVDFSDTGLAKSAKLAAANNVKMDIIHADLDQWEWGAPRFDLVVGIFFQFADPPFRDRIFANMARVLRPGGLLMIEGYGLNQLKYRTGGPSVPEQLYTPELLRTSFAELEELLMAEYEAELSEGARHKGMSAVVDFVARKKG